MAFFNRKLYRQKPKQWGPVSQVQSSIFANADREGYDPGSIALAMPMWGPGDQLDYANYLSGANTNYSYNKNALVADASAKILIPDTDVLEPLSSPFTWLFRFKSANDGTFQRLFEKTIEVNNERVVRCAIDYVDSVTVDMQLLLGNAVGGWADNTQRMTSPGITDTINYGFVKQAAISPTPTRFYINDNYASKNLTLDGTTQKNTTADFQIGSVIVAGGLFEQVLFFRAALTPSQIAHLSDNPYFLLHPRPSVFYSVPSGAITLRQFGFRFYQDDADHTPIGTENDANVSLAPGSKFRIRMGIVKE